MMAAPMQTSPQSSLLQEDEQPDAVSLAAAAALRGTTGHFDELRGRPSESGPAGEVTVSPLWRQFFDATGTEGWLDMGARLARVQRRVREDGASFNVHSPNEEGARPWPLELLPFIINVDEWAEIERGAVQRARMLEAVVADLYGPRELLREGLLPASLVLGDPQYLRPMQGVQPAGGRWLHVVGIDLARGPFGRWWVVGHRTQAPSGLGYLLENRLIIAQQFSPAFRAMRAQRLAAAFQALVEGLTRASPAGERSRIALLTPGPRNETYFEQVFLARYLGLTLVEGSDLTVRDQRLYLKTMHGLERVHVLLRRVDDEWLDPLELRSDSALGVPGLMQAVRAGELVLANAPGTGVLESPGLTAFWPAVARHTLGEELLLPASTSWWCGEAAVWRELRGNLDDYIVAPTFSAGPVTQDFVPVAAGDLEPAARRALEARIDADPAAHTLLARVRPSEMPVWHQGRLEPRPAVVRVYAMADGKGGWRVLPGGFTRVAQVAQGRSAGTDAFLSMQRGSASADTWVLTDGVVDNTSLLPRPLAPADLAVWHRVVTSRAAENLFWLGRYTERAETTLRLARLTLEALTNASRPVLGALHTLVVRHGLVEADVPSPAQESPQAARVFERALVQGLLDTQAGSSVAFNLGSLRHCATALRERLSPEHWTLIQAADDDFTALMQALRGQDEAGPAIGDVLAVLNRLGTQLAAITGAQTDRMTRDDGWRLLSVGRMIERLDSLSYALATAFEAGLPDLDDGFALVLGLFDSTITYRAHFQARREALPLVHLLVLDTDNPRSLAWVARTMRERLRKLARHDKPWADSICAELPAPDRWTLDTLGLADATQDHTRLIAAVEECSEAARALSDAISRHLFSHVGAPQRAVWQ
jgi:uncharacterized circularly permuted ATP-grasp superfamily protein/uncharacterized alpha-E superfamily protein